MRLTRCLLKQERIWREAASGYKLEAGFTVQVGPKNEDGTAIIPTTQENAIKRLLVKDLQYL